MTIPEIGELISRVGVPIALSAVFIWLILDIYKTTRDKVVGQLKAQAVIIRKMAETVSTTSKAMEIVALTLNKICSIVEHTETMSTKLIDMSTRKPEP